MLGAAIAVSALLGLADRGVDVVGELPDALPDPALPDVAWRDLADLVPTALGVMILSTEAVGVARALASADGYAVDVNREMVALGGANAIAGLTSGFVQSGGASQTAAAESAGGASQGTAVVAAVLILGVLPGLLVAAVLSMGLLVFRLSRPHVGGLGRDPDTGAWGQLDRHPGWIAPDGVVVARVDGPLFYANSAAVKERLMALARPGEPLVLQLEQDDIDVESLDVLGELQAALARDGSQLRLTEVRAPVARLLDRAGLAIPVDHPSRVIPPPTVHP